MCAMMHMNGPRSNRTSGDYETAMIHPAAVTRARTRLSGEPVEALARLFAVVGDPTRLRVLLALRGGELCVHDLAAATGINRSTVSHQLRVLRDNRLVRRRREGKVLFYAVDDHHVEALLATAAEHVGETTEPVPLPAASKAVR